MTQRSLQEVSGGGKGDRGEKHAFALSEIPFPTLGDFYLSMS